MSTELLDFKYREVTVLRFVLKHLRQRRFLTPFNDVLSRSDLELEHPLVTQLYDSIVIKGDWSRAEEALLPAASSGLFDSYRYARAPHAHWTQLHALDADGSEPSRRGGHAMCIDEQNGLIYLFGGWDGQRNMDDFWVYNVHHDTWKCLSAATSRDENGPSPRACHKMVFNSKTGSIYLLGRLGDGDSADSADTRDGNVGSPRPTSPGRNHERPTDPPRARDVTPLPWLTYRSEFYRYDTRGVQAGKWTLLSTDTSVVDGPSLIFDHQMVIECEAQVIWVSGGRVVDGEWEICKYSGLYSYDIRTGLWQAHMSGSNNVDQTASSRFGHSMLLEPISRTLIIFAGQRDDKYLSDMYAYHIPSGTMTSLFSNFSAIGGPDACFTQRAAIDPELHEIYVFSGLSRNRSGMTVLESDAPSWVYRFDRPDRPGKWSKILLGDSPAASSSHPPDRMAPSPRYAHQVVYDSINKIIYMHGGNSGIVRDGNDDHASFRDAARERPLEGPDATKEDRLDDFWNMHLQRYVVDLSYRKLGYKARFGSRPLAEDIVRRARYDIRQQQFREMCEDAPAVQALAFLQTKVSEVVNHSDSDEAHIFRSLLSHLLASTKPMAPSSTSQRHAGILSSDHDLASSAKTGRDMLADALQSEDEEMEDRTGETQGGLESQPVIRLEEDPAETLSVGVPPSAERFKQRTEVFEKLMVFVKEDAKQPDRNLLDLINTDEYE
ncbi:uncharacterized protein FIBRA_04401 [Fibroporia radiculosa]|uniref:LisH domain-containing protein n=1 Tax=Fibroporia radiculosa TaxID=599839 RepID=J4GP70_9APHY|nr:uncharacterized protein FIBRA_04401 [Fibroporia radiculosa]CCM02310.1 predicted protein [Fibroporia radiculosa]